MKIDIQLISNMCGGMILFGATGATFDLDIVVSAVCGLLVGLWITIKNRED